MLVTSSLTRVADTGEHVTDCSSRAVPVLSAVTGPSSGLAYRGGMTILHREQRSHARNWLLPTALGAMVAVGCIAGLPSSATAHDYLVSSTPGADSTLTKLPAEFDITANDALLELGAASEAFALRVTDSAGLYYGDGCVTIDGASMRSTASLGAPGAYTVTWGVVSADGHPISDTFGFTWAPGVGEVPSKGSATVPECGVTTIEADIPGSSGDPTPSATPGASASPSPDPLDGDATSDTESGSNGADGSFIPWMVGGVVAVAAAVGGSIFLSRRRKG